MESILPEADPLFLNRACANWGYRAVDAAQQYGEDGVNVLETFGDDADYLLKNNPKAFAALARVWKLDPVQFRLAANWNRGVIDWAQEGKLDAFLHKIERLPAGRLATAGASPASLPLLLVEGAPQAHAVLDQYGDRAWRLLMSINFMDSPASVERVAEAVAKYHDLPLDLNERYGLPAALMLVAPPTEKGSKRIPDVVQHAYNALDPPLAAVLMLLNYDDVAKMLDAGVEPEELFRAIDLLAGQPEFVQMLAAEEGHILRLLTESWRGQNVGIEAFRRCGPAATIAYTFYGSDRRLSQAAVVSMGRVGWPAFDVLNRFREYGPFYDLLRRPELTRANDLNPLVIDAVGNVSRYGQEKIEVYLHTANLPGELMQDRYPVPSSEMVLQWVPLYMAYRVGEKYAKGLHVSDSELLWAGVDVALTLTPLKGSGKAASGAKVLAEAAERDVAETLVSRTAGAGLGAGERKLLATAERELVSSAEKTALEILKREGVDLTRCGAEAGKIAMKRLEARGDGIMLGLADRSAEYIAAKDGDLAIRRIISEEIGMEGARRYALETGCEPLYQGTVGQGRGFDFVFRDCNRIKVIEAKGNTSRLKPTYGHMQGTPENVRAVAEDVLARSSASADEKAAAKEVLKAMKEGRLDIEVVRTEHVYGKPKPTRVEGSVSVNSNTTRLSANEIKSLLLRTPGATLAFVRDGGNESGHLTMESFINRSQAMAKRAGVELWKPGAGPLMPHTVRRKGEEVIINTLQLPVAGDPSGVGEFGLAIMERLLK